MNEIVLPQIVFYALVGAFCASAIILAVVALSFKRLLFKFYMLKEHESKMKRNISEVADDIMATTQAEAVEIVYKAREHAAKIIDEAGKINEDQKSYLKAALEKSASKYAEEYSQMITQIRQKSESVLSEEIVKMRSELSLKTASLSDSLIQKIDTEYKNVDAKIEEYRQSMFKKVDSSIYKLLEDVSLEVIGKSMNFEEHQDVVTRALDAAKRRNVF